MELVPGLYAIRPLYLKLFLFAATLAVMAWAGRDFYARTANMNTLIAVGTGAVFLASAAATFFPGAFTRAGLPADVYYEAVVWIIALVLLGRMLEARAMGKASAAIARLLALAPPTACVLRDGREVGWGARRPWRGSSGWSRRRSWRARRSSASPTASPRASCRR